MEQMSAAAEALQANLDAGAFAADHAFLIQRVLDELRELQSPPANRMEYGLASITIHDDLTLPEGFQLTKHSEVRFRTGPTMHEYLDLYMPTTRDHGWVQISTSPFHNPTVQLRNGSLMLRAEKV